MDAITETDRAGVLTTPLGENAMLLHRLDAQEMLSDPFLWRVEAISNVGKISFDQILGESCTFSFPTHGTNARHFNGICTKITSSGFKSDLPHYYLELRPTLWLLKLQSNSRVFKETKPADIVAQVLREAGQINFELLIFNDCKPIPYCVQYQETNFAFISRIMERYGLFYFFKHTAEKHILCITDSPSAYLEIPDYDTVPYFPSLTEQQERDHFYRVETAHGIRSDKVEVNDYNYERASASLEERAASLEDHFHNENSLYINHAGYRELDDAKDLAKVALESARVPAHTISVLGNTLGVSSGVKLDIENNPLPKRLGKLVCLKAHHEVLSRSYRSEHELPDEDFCRGTYEFLPVETVYRAPQTTPWPKIGGLQTATVVGEKGEEIDVDDQGRILVHFHWERDKESSCRVRVAQALAGSGFGAVQIPRIGHEVIVSFIDGDPDRPLVVGSVYNSDNRMPIEMPSSKTQMGFVSRSSPGGGGFNEMVLDDSKESEGIRLHAQKDMSTIVENDKTTEVKNDLTETIGNNKKLDVENNRETTIHTGDDSTKISSGNRSTLVSTGSDSLSIPLGSRTETIGTGSIISNVGMGAMMNNIGIGTYTTIVGVGPHLTRVNAGSMAASVTGTIHYTASSNITTKSDTEICLSVGKSSIRLTKDGIEIDAPKLKFTGTSVEILSKGDYVQHSFGPMTIYASFVDINGNPPE